MTRPEHGDPSRPSEARRLALASLVALLSFCLAPLDRWGLGAFLPWEESSAVLGEVAEVRFAHRSDPRWFCGDAVSATVFRNGRARGSVWKRGGYSDCSTPSFGALLLDRRRVIVRIGGTFYVEVGDALVPLDSMDRARRIRIRRAIVEASDSYRYETYVALAQLLDLEGRKACSLLDRTVARLAAREDPETLQIEWLRPPECRRDR